MTKNSPRNAALALFLISGATFPVCAAPVNPDFSRCLVEGCGGLTSVVVEQGQSFGHGFLARCGELAGIIRRIMKLGCFPCGPGVQMAALSSAAHAVRKTSV